MLKDREGNTINLSEDPNGHLLVLGRSGAGKTYFSCRKIETEMEKRKKIYVFDYSSSYSLNELKKNKFKYMDNTKISNPLNEPLNWIFSGNDIKKLLSDALLRGLRIRSYYQKKLLSKAIAMVFSKDDCFSIPRLIEQLTDLHYLEEDIESQKNALHLLNRLDPYSEIKEIMISSKKQEENGENLHIIQLSDYPEIQRTFLTEFLAELFWAEVRYGEKRSDIVLFDEFQNMNIRRGNALSSLLREGRKFGISVYLYTQFMGNYDKEAVDTLTQVGNLIFFKPTENEMNLTSKLINPNHPKNWKSILNRLRTGEAIIKGTYTLNNNKKEICTPILCKVQEVKNI